MMRRIANALVEHGRALEWLTSLVLLGFALTLALPGDTLSLSGSYRGFRNLGLDEAAISTPLALIAAARLVALYINGAWRRSPVMRAAGAAVGGAVFFMLSVTFSWDWLTGASVALGTGGATYAMLGLFDVLAAYRSGADVRIARHH